MFCLKYAEKLNDIILYIIQKLFKKLQTCYCYQISKYYYIFSLKIDYLHTIYSFKESNIKAILGHQE